MAKTSFTGPVASANGFEGNVTGSIQVPTYTVATAPSAAGLAGAVIYVSDGLAGDPCLAVSDGTIWVSPAGTAIAAS